MMDSQSECDSSEETEVVRRRRKRNCSIKKLNATPMQYSGNLYPTNHVEQKIRFFRFGLTPVFTMKESNYRMRKLVNRPSAAIRFEYLAEAERILKMVKDRYGDGLSYIQETYGKQINHQAATKILTEYLREHNLNGKLKIYWTPELTCSARIIWTGPNCKSARPERRSFTIVIKNTTDNEFLREFAIRCLADHEIGTHFYRAYNDGYQPWFTDRKHYGLRGLHSRQHISTEEGLATINTLLNARCKYLWSAALKYYTACRAKTMSFQELYDDLGQYIFDCEYRWKQVMRVKRALSDPNSVGGYGGDQSYFEGAVEILRNIEDIDWNVLYSGKICLDEVSRVRRVCRKNLVKLPQFLQNQSFYKSVLWKIAQLNCLVDQPVMGINLQPSSKEDAGSRTKRSNLVNSGRRSTLRFSNKCDHPKMKLNSTTSSVSLKTSHSAPVYARWFPSKSIVPLQIYHL